MLVLGGALLMYLPKSGTLAALLSPLKGLSKVEDEEPWRAVEVVRARTARAGAAAARMAARETIETGAIVSGQRQEVLAWIEVGAERRGLRERGERARFCSFGVAGDGGRGRCSGDGIDGCVMRSRRRGQNHGLRFFWAELGSHLSRHGKPP